MPCSRLLAGWLKAPVIELLVQRGLDLNAVDETGRNQLHIALTPPVEAPFEGISYLVQAGVPLNARDHSGKTPLGYWREPREFEQGWLTMWLIERLTNETSIQRDRENRRYISALLKEQHAVL